MKSDFQFWEDEKVLEMYKEGEDISYYLYRLAWNIMAKDSFKSIKNKEDLVQHAMEHILKKIHKYDFDRGSKLFSYLWKVAYHSIIYDIRENNRKKKLRIEHSINSMYSLKECNVEEENYIEDVDEIWDRAREVIKKESKESLNRRLSILDDIIDNFNHGIILKTENKQAITFVKRLLKDNADYIRHGK